MIVVSQAVVLYFATTLVQLAGGSPEILGVAAITTFLAMVWGWRKFRHGGVVVEGTGVRRKSVLRTTLGLLFTGRRGRVIQDMMDGEFPTLE
jgi:hypothetical protein